MGDGDFKPPTSMNDALNQMKVVFTPPANPELTSGSTVVRANTKEGMTQKYYAKYAHEKSGSYFKTYDVVAQAAVYKISSDSNAPIQDVDVAVMEARADRYMGSYIGRDASLNLVSGHASIFDFKVGVAASTGIGIKDGAVEAKLLGCGFSLGKRVELSIFGTGFGVNFGRLALHK
ncbi:hypothetical protein BDZ94DRAFT_1052368 [Collybia nuda]|uniref:Uncharacterized protein n=1 Tax=Collybia nuda TaxID=64659 RepID=A0A9P5Y0V8_9AGAR|nr:hypothetical protein BDZ94DRAFT_1052368 [Collybia nuda]